MNRMRGSNDVFRGPLYQAGYGLEGAIQALLSLDCPVSSKTHCTSRHIGIERNRQHRIELNR